MPETSYAIRGGVEGLFFHYLSSLVLQVDKVGQISSTMLVVSNTYCPVMPQLLNIELILYLRAAESLKQ